MTPFQPFTLNISGRAVRFDRPAVMGIINVTDNSFYGSSRASTPAEIVAKAADMVAQGADILDIGACSSRQGSKGIDPDIETTRAVEAVRAIREAGIEVPLSVDTYVAEVAREAVAAGADIVNDVSGGLIDSEMFATVAMLGVPYVLTHMRSKPEDMQLYASYSDVTAEVLAELSPRLNKLSLMGVNDVIIDPGFGLAKTPAQCFELLRNLNAVASLGLPVLAGLSRKTMFWEPLGLSPDDVLPATVSAGEVALLQGASILRVHDVEAARQCVFVYQSLLP